MEVHQMVGQLVVIHLVEHQMEGSHLEVDLMAYRLVENHVVEVKKIHHQIAIQIN